MTKIYSRYGILIAIILIAYFLLSKLMGLHQYYALSAVNGLIYGVGLYLAIKKFGDSENEMKFEKGFELGLFTGAVATVIFTIFMAIYMYQIDTDFAAAFMDQWGLEYNSGTLVLLISILIMGFVTTLVLTFSFMQLLKKSWNTRDGNRNILK